jgi:O-antigen ligase
MSSQVTSFADPFRPVLTRPPGLSFLLVPLALAALVDFPGSFRSGSISALGVLGALQVLIAAIGLLVVGIYPRAVLSLFWPYGLFLAWMWGRSLVDWPSQGGPNQGALQNGMAYTLFGIEFLLGAAVAAVATSSWSMPVLLRGFRLFDVIGLAMAALSIATGLPGEGFDATWVINPRSLALVAIIPISWHLARWSHGHRGEGVRALLWIVAVFASLSRTVTAVATVTFLLALLVQLWLRPGQFVRRAPLIAMGMLLVGLLVIGYGSTFSDRFFGGYTRYEIAGFSVSTSGRTIMWPIVFDSAMEHPFVGGGLASSQIALGEGGGGAQEFVQPHNEYLRVWHDGGLIGISLLVFSFISWLLQLRRQYAWAVRTSRPHPEIELAAFFTLLGIVLAAITDNGFMYMFVDAPSGLLIGVAFGVRLFEESASHKRFAPVLHSEAPLGA